VGWNIFERGLDWVGFNEGSDEWLRMGVKATECKRIPAAFLKAERRAMDAASFSQEYMCEFTSNDTSVFARDVVEAALDDSVTKLKIRDR
jgi:hypothetical protein